MSVGHGSAIIIYLSAWAKRRKPARAQNDMFYQKSAEKEIRGFSLSPTRTANLRLLIRSASCGPQDLRERLGRTQRLGLISQIVQIKFSFYKYNSVYHYSSPISLVNCAWARAKLLILSHRNPATSPSWIRQVPLHFIDICCFIQDDRVFQTENQAIKRYLGM